MARNRKSQSAAIRFGPALKAFLLCLLIGGSGVGYVWQKEQIAMLGKQIKSKEAEQRRLEVENGRLERLLANMRSPTFLELQIRKSGLGLAQPKDNQIIWLREPLADPVRAVNEAQYAARSDRPAFSQ